MQLYREIQNAKREQPPLPELAQSFAGESYIESMLYQQPSFTSILKQITRKGTLAKGRSKVNGKAGVKDTEFYRDYLHDNELVDDDKQWDLDESGKSEAKDEAPKRFHKFFLLNMINFF